MVATLNSKFQFISKKVEETENALNNEMLQRELALKKVEEKLSGMIPSAEMSLQAYIPRKVDKSEAEEMLKDLEGKLREDISALTVAVKNEIAKVDQQLSTVEVRVGIVEELVKDRPTNKQVTEQL